ncbi:MAG: carotenoid oxygenase family protein [Myxococcota bacterium]|nr:carotenoid oxygenase family protein [Myxococcota bacterium]
MGRFQFDASHPYLRGNFKPMRFEGTAPFLEVEGELPADFQGVFYLNGACPQFPPTGRYHWFAGDGKVHGYYFRGDGVVDYVSRWVRTENFELERAAKRALFGNKKYGAQSEIDPSVRHIRPQTANTNIIYHGGRLLALEDGSPPISLDPWTLETHGAYDFEGALQGPMTAHVHHDPESGSMIGFGRQLGGPGSPLMSYQEVNSAGRLIRDDRFEAPYCALLHDFAISTNCAVYPLGPAILDPTRPRRGEPVLQWEPTRPSYLGLFPRAPGGTPRWIPMDPAFVWHTLNAFQEGPRLSVDLVRYRALPRYDEGADVRSVKDPRYAGQLVRWSVDLSEASDVVSEEPLDDLISEFPRVDERVGGRKHRHA